MRQFDDKCRAGTDMRTYFDASVMKRDDTVDECHADTVSGSITAVFAAIKRFEDMRQFLIGDPDAGIRKRNDGIFRE